MKVIIPVAGLGSRLRPITHTQPKVLVPIAGKPILAHIIDYLIESGICDFVFILGYLGEKIESFVNTNYQDKINAEFVVQEPREGSAHAVWVGRHFFEQEKEILIFFGDSIVNLDMPTFLQSPQSTVAVKKVLTPTIFGIAELDQEAEYVAKVIEKPKIPKSNLALVGLYKINNVPLLLQSIGFLVENNLRTNNEFQLTDALMRMIHEGEQIKPFYIDNWFDCGRKETLLEANAILLNSHQHQQKTYKEFPNAIIIPPVSIGNNCKIEHAIIGPNVAIGENTIVQKAIVRNSIIGSFSELNEVVLQNSIIGNDTILRGLVQSLNIGDNTEINFGLGN